MLKLKMSVIALMVLGTSVQAQNLMKMDAFTDKAKAMNAISLPKAYYGVYGADKKACAYIKEQEKAGVDAEATHINELGIVHVPVSTCQLQSLSYEGAYVKGKEQCFSEGEEVVRSVKYQMSEGGRLVMLVGGDKKPWILQRCD